jgi:uncharacterized Zn-finger protein
MTKPTVELSVKDLNHAGAVCCPSPLAHMEVASSHPKVFLNVGHSGQAKCPYCGTSYKLKAGEHFEGH